MKNKSTELAQNPPFCKTDVSGSLQFTMVDVKDKLPTLENDEGVVIAFVPLQGFQSCKYYNGSKSWQSMITRQTVDVTHWLLRNDR